MAIHLVGRHPWRFDAFVIPGMLGESLLWTAPLFVFDRVLQTARLAIAASERQAVWFDEVVLSLGAGLYEELVFRLICITALSILFVDLFKLPRVAAAVLVMILSAALFAAHHHYPLGSEPFHATRFAFRTGAGLYLSALFIFRGFGIAAGCHGLYNVIVVTIAAVHR
jgi:membrane protease YdiL (CAAX protease family)